MASAVAACPPIVTVAPAIVFFGAVPCSTTLTVTSCSVRSLGLAAPFVTVTGTSTVWPFAVTVTVPAPVAISGTPGTVTEPSLSASWAVCVPLLPSFTVTVAPLSTVKVTPGVPAFASSICAGVALPLSSTARVLPLIAVYPAASAFRSW